MEPTSQTISPSHSNNNNNNNNRIQIIIVSNTRAQVAQAQSCANHVQHIKPLSRASIMLRATWYEGTAQQLSLTELKSHNLFELYFVSWIIKPMKYTVYWHEANLSYGWHYNARHLIRLSRESCGKQGLIPVSS